MLLCIYLWKPIENVLCARSHQSIVHNPRFAYAMYTSGASSVSRRFAGSRCRGQCLYSVRWYDTVPLSRIISRCTTDIAAIDDDLPNWTESLLQKLIVLIIALAAVVYIAGWRAVLMGSVITIAGVGCSRVYLKAQLCVKRENSNARSPGIFLLCFRKWMELNEMMFVSSLAFSHRPVRSRCVVIYILLIYIILIQRSEH